MTLASDAPAVSVFCDDCEEAFYVVDTPAACPYCGDENISPGYPVAVRAE